MQTIGIYVNKRKARAVEMAGRAAQLARAAGLACTLLADNREHSLEDDSREKLFVQACDFILVLGGDGTILRIAASAAEAGVPLLSVNLGHLGFLTELEPEELEKGLKRLAEGNFTVEERMMLACRVGEQTMLALNDICLQRASRARLLKFSVFAGEEVVDRLAADGVLVSSPTGSTAYSLSAGGPVVSPRVSLLLMTPICAHTLRARPIVFREDEMLRFTTPDECGFAVFQDGVHKKDLDGVREVVVFRSEKNLKLISFRQTSFYKRLGSKLMEWNAATEV